MKIKKFFYSIINNFIFNGTRIKADFNNRKLKF